MDKRGFKIYEGKAIEQIVGHCGDGKLKDGNDTQKELREYLDDCDIETLEKHARECRESAFNNDKRAAGLVLQDIVNTLAKCWLGLQVEHGRYSGTRNEEDNGVDGVWHTQEHDFVVEVKKKEDFSMNLKDIVKYRDQLLQEEKIDGKNHSFLLVMGEMKKEALVAQVRGLPRAWDTRIITVDYLIQLVKLKHKNSFGLSDDYFHDILKPLDYICVDGLVTLLAEIVSDVTNEDKVTNRKEGRIQETEKNKQESKSHEPEDTGHRDRIITMIEKETGGNLVQKGRTRFENSKTGELFFISFSKKHREKQNAYYWYTYNYNRSNKCNFLALCTKEENDWFYLIPVETIEKLVDEGKLNFNDQKNFRRVHIAMDMNKGEMMLRLKKGYSNKSLKDYKVLLPSRNKTTS